MKSNILLVAQRPNNSHPVVAQAAIEAGRGIRHATTSHEAFEILAEGIDKIDTVIVDLDPGIDTLSFLGALSFHKAAPPIIFVTDPNEEEIARMAYRHGATACIGRPFTALELAALISDVCL